MRKLIKAFVILTAFAALAAAQQPNIPINTTPTQPSIRPEANRKTGVTVGAEDKSSPKIGLRRPTKKEMKAVEPSEEDKTKYAEILKMSDTGLFKLVSDINCDANEKTDKRCDDLTMPGHGAMYSFRLGRHVGYYFCDIKFKENAIFAAGDSNLGFFVKAGDVPLDKVSRETLGAAYVYDFAPPTELEDILKNFKAFQQGVENSDFTYKSAVLAAENTTIIFRLIAYRKEITGERQQQLRDQNEEMREQGSEIDKRKDIIVAFRVVRKDSDGSITILWRELQKKDAPVFRVKQPAK
ncbi:MAG: hypothetical protein JSS81_13430 [Acidobacteria bacterium]|nr:hypothetical protein [Acidobacteriota bacterium]